MLLSAGILRLIRCEGAELYTDPGLYDLNGNEAVSHRPHLHGAIRGCQARDAGISRCRFGF